MESSSDLQGLIQEIQEGSAFASLKFRRRLTPGIEMLLRRRVPVAQISECSHRIVDDALHQIRNRVIADVVILLRYVQGLIPPRDCSLNTARHQIPASPRLTAAVRDALLILSPKVKDVLCDYYETGDIDGTCQCHAISTEYLHGFRLRIRNEVQRSIDPIGPYVVNQILASSR